MCYTLIEEFSRKLLIARKSLKDSFSTKNIFSEQDAYVNSNIECNSTYFIKIIIMFCLYFPRQYKLILRIKNFSVKIIGQSSDLLATKRKIKRKIYSSSKRKYRYKTIKKIL